MGDRARPVTGNAGMIVPSANGRDIGTDLGDGCFDAVLKSGTLWGVNAPVRNDKYIYSLGLETDRVTSTGAVNAPRSWGSLACAYLGQQSAV